MRIKPVFYLLLCLFILYHLPVFWLGEHAYYNAFDTLDSYVVWYRMVIEGGFADAPPATTIPQIMGGLPKFTLVHTFGLYYLLNLCFSTFHALNILMLTASLTGLCGMWLLVRYHWKLALLPAAFISLSFAFTPFLPAWTLSIAGQPLLLFALLNLRGEKPAWWNWLIVGIFPFISNFQSAGIFILAGLTLGIILDARRGLPVGRLVLAGLLLSVFYLSGKIDLLGNLLAGDGFISHRTEILRYAVSPAVCFKVFLRYFLFGNIDVALSLHTLVLLPFVLLVFGFNMLQNRRPDTRLLLLLLTITAICAYVAVLQWEPVVKLRNELPLLRMFSMDRFHIFLQLLWHLAAAQSCLLLEQRLRTTVLIPVFAAQMLVCFAYQPTWYTLFVKPVVRITPYQYLFRYDDYYAAPLFAAVRQRIGPPETHRIACIGFPPAIAQYNGFWTIDGYVPNYPLAYKHAFRKIIARELPRNQFIQGFFDNWGSQCIILYAQNGGNFNTHVTRDLAPPFRDIRLEGDALKALNCRFVLSAETLEYPGESGLKALATYSSSYWKLTLYEVM